MHCAVNLDASANTSLDSVDGALDRALARGETLELYAHSPGGTVPFSTLEHVLAGAHDRGLAFVTYRDFAEGGGTGPALALSLDDTAVRAWTSTRPLFDQYGAHVTFFVSEFYRFSDEDKAELHALSRDGHDVEPHTVHHLNGPQYVEAHGLGAYLHDEVWPSADALEAEGFTLSAFAYPFGARTDEIDDAIGSRFSVLRSVEFTYDGVVSPCPE